MAIYPSTNMSVLGQLLPQRFDCRTKWGGRRLKTKELYSLPWQWQRPRQAAGRPTDRRTDRQTSISAAAGEAVRHESGPY